MWTRLGVGIVVLFASACGVQIEPGQQQAGQVCYQTNDCADGLTCFDRRCAPLAIPRESPGNNIPGNNQNNDNNDNNQNNPPNNRPDMPPDMPACVVGEARCLDSQTLEICVDSPDGPILVDQRCDSCVAGRCIPAGECVDRDGDGFGIGECNGPQDCNDSNPAINPGAPEDCSTQEDDNCNGRTNEGCEECCPNGCADGTFCNTECVCEDFNPNICTEQNQPCNTEGSFNNGLYCASFSGEAPKCYGLCDRTDPDPDSTCPFPNSRCVFGEDEFGVCLTECVPGSSCGAADLGCLAFGSEDPGGICTPTTPGIQIGDSCDPLQGFSCGAGGLCVPNPNNPDRGRCEQSCRPFRFALQSGTDCDEGHCIPFAEDFGVCRRDNMRTEGQPCAAEGTACNADAVGCFPSFQGRRCQRLCRLGQGNNDCTAGTFCNQFAPDQTEIGVCTVLAP